MTLGFWSRVCVCTMSVRGMDVWGGREGVLHLILAAKSPPGTSLNPPPREHAYIFELVGLLVRHFSFLSLTYSTCHFYSVLYGNVMHPEVCDQYKYLPLSINRNHPVCWDALLPSSRCCYLDRPDKPRLAWDLLYRPVTFY